MSFLVDTNVLSELPKRVPNPRVVAWLEAQSGVAVSAITIEEIVFGIERAKPDARQRLREWFDVFLAAKPLVVPIDERVARAAGRMRARRAHEGRTVPQADMLIAATAVETGRTLATRNTKDFAGCGVDLFDPFR